ncbi:MAG: sulfur carrier protein ThiS, partial [Acidimicrobiales bacterium]
MISVNGQPEEFTVESVEALLTRLDIQPRGIAVALNGQVVRRAEWSMTLIADESAVEIVTAAAGG